MAPEHPIIEKVFITGFMGSGKSTLGRSLAQATGSSFYDLDAAIEALSSSSIPELFQSLGEGKFRKLELDTLHQLLAKTKPPFILSLGGGTLLNPEAAALVKKTGTLVFLDVDLSVLAQRLWNQRDSRPLIQGATDRESFLKTLEKLHQERKSGYFSASIRIPIHSQTETETLATLRKTLETH